MFAPIKKIPDWNYYIYCIIASLLAYMFFLSKLPAPNSALTLLGRFVEAIGFNGSFLLLAPIKLICKLFKYNLKLKIISTIWICFVALTVLARITSYGNE